MINDNLNDDHNSKIILTQLFALNHLDFMKVLVLKATNDIHIGVGVKIIWKLLHITYLC
ncbi:hypothetical protein Lalb_Chr22g0359801 [Lupinus albus]|uniref:Uncharacterized protein n=1 Tax=Lupinus albus TaxID=3870 RepID=A0A6A4NQF7_LUPAL|nr:hypothetical protein Lalb_Chr22g0359801 [Lupinus albus]